MAMKVTVFYGDQKYGWSETYYWNSGSDIVAAFTAMDSLLRVRMRLCGNNIKVLAIRVSDPTIRRRMRLFPKSLLKPYPYYYEIPNDPGGRPSDNPYSNVQITLLANDFTSGRFFFGGVPDDFINDQLFSPRSTWIDNFSVFMGALKLQGWAIRSSYINGGAPNALAITGFATVGGVTQISVPGSNWAIGSRIYVAGCRDASRQRINRLYTVTGLASGEGVYVVNPTYLTLNVVRFGTASLRGQSFINITGAYYGDPVSRKRGLPFGSPHGRRKPRVIPL